RTRGQKAVHHPEIHSLSIRADDILATAPLMNHILLLFAGDYSHKISTNVLLCMRHILGYDSTMSTTFTLIKHRTPVSGHRTLTTQYEVPTCPTCPPCQTRQNPTAAKNTR